MLFRSEDLPADIKAAIEMNRGDLKDPDAVHRAVDGQEWVFHLGALIAIPLPRRTGSRYAK